MKGKKFKCLACNGKGLILGSGGVARTCKGCNGQGYIIQ